MLHVFSYAGISDFALWSLIHNSVHVPFFVQFFQFYPSTFLVSDQISVAKFNIAVRYNWARFLWHWAYFAKNLSSSDELYSSNFLFNAGLFFSVVNFKHNCWLFFLSSLFQSLYLCCFLRPYVNSFRSNRDIIIY